MPVQEPRRAPTLEREGRFPVYLRFSAGPQPAYSLPKVLVKMSGGRLVMQLDTIFNMAASYRGTYVR